MLRLLALCASVLSLVSAGCSMAERTTVRTVPVVLPPVVVASTPARSEARSRSLGWARGESVRIAPVAPVDRGAPRVLARRRIDLDLHAAPVAEVFRLLADVGDLNVVLAEGITGEVTIRLRRVTLRDALRAVAATHSLDLSWEGNILFVRPAT
ncbi:MAG: hypothetical protein HYY06_06400 [Deltaproteobacteria bacterium]|nr:hypothetical protein [Deltaproteobacteria bacterium]